MKKFMDENFLLETEVAQKLYHEYAKDMPIFDYHCHLSPKEISEDKRYKNITEMWLGGDHYKWRAMRSFGVPEESITGNSEDKEKFIAWIKTLSTAIGNPLYHWSHLELQRYFNISETATLDKVDMLWDKCNAMIETSGFSARELIKKSNVKALCTTDDPIDNLKYHIELKEDKTFDTKVLPTFRPDKAVNIDKQGFTKYIETLANVVGYKIDSYAKLCKAMKERIDFFHSVGCRVSDHGLDFPQYLEATTEELEIIFKKGLSEETLTGNEIRKYKGQLVQFFGKEYSKRNWVMQLHMGALRNNSKRMFELLGADVGFDSIGDWNM
ncbi:MAG: glucuronate isomerase, partial [Fusobacteriaceae bacterium]